MGRSRDAFPWSSLVPLRERVCCQNVCGEAPLLRERVERPVDASFGPSGARAWTSYESSWPRARPRVRPPPAAVPRAAPTRRQARPRCPVRAAATSAQRKTAPAVLAPEPAAEPPALAEITDPERLLAATVAPGGATVPREASPADPEGELMDVNYFCRSAGVVVAHQGADAQR